MTTTSPWGPQDGPPQPPPSSMPPNPGMPLGGGPGAPVGPPTQGGAFGPPPKRPGNVSWGLLAAFTGIVVVAVAATAAITYAIASNDSAAPPPTQTAAPHFTSNEQLAAKDHVCHIVDLSTRQVGQGGVVLSDGQLNMPVVIGTLNSVVAVQNALTPAVPPEVTAAARKFIDTSLDLTAAATGNVPTTELNRLNDVSNSAIFGLADVCGLAH